MRAKFRKPRLDALLPFRPLGALLGYFLLSLLLLSPVLPAFNQAIPGGPIAEDDGWQNVWNLWWTARALAEFRNPFVTSLIFYPSGASLYLQPLNITNGVIGIWLTWMAGPIAAYNFCLLLAFTLAGWGAYLLTRYLVRHEGVAWLAGLLFTCSPFHLTKLSDGQLELISLQWIPFFILFLLRALEEGRVVNYGLAGLFFALVALTSWYYGLFCAIFSGIFIALRIITNRQRWRTTLKRSLLALGGGIVLLLPILILAVLTWPPPAASAAKTVQPLIILHSADIVDFFLPSTMHALWGDWAYRLGAQFHPGIGGNLTAPLAAGWNVALGYTAIALSLYGLVMATQQTWHWGVLLLCTVVLSLGPSLHIAGWDTGLPMPYALLLQIPGLDVVRRPNQFAALASLSLVVLAAHGLSALLSRLRPPWPRLALGMAVFLIAIEYWPRPLPLLRPSVHPYYATLAEEEGAILELPLQHESSDLLLAQIIHGRPITGGFLARTPLYPFADNVPGISNLCKIVPVTPDIFGYKPNLGLIALRGFGFRHIVIHRNLLPTDQQEKLTRILFEVLGDIHPAFQDSEISVYAIPEVPVEPFAYLYADEGWYERECKGEQCWRWASSVAQLRLFNPLDSKVRVQIEIRWRSYLRPRVVAVSLDQRPLGQVEVPLAPTMLWLGLNLSPGEHLLSFRTEADRETGPPYRELSLAYLSVRLSTLESGATGVMQKSGGPR